MYNQKKKKKKQRFKKDMPAGINSDRWRKHRGSLGGCSIPISQAAPTSHPWKHSVWVKTECAVSLRWFLEEDTAAAKWDRG